MNDTNLVGLLCMVALLILMIFIKIRLPTLLQEKDLSLLLSLCSDESKERFEEKRWKKLHLVAILLLVWPLYQFHMVYLIFLGFAAVLLYKQPYVALQRKQKYLLERMRYDFPMWLRQLQILLQNNTVLHALEVSYESSPALIKVPLRQLIVAIEENPVSIVPYLSFMKEFEIYEIQKAMKLLYRYHFVGAEESYQQFHRMIEATSKWLRQARNERKANKLYLLQWLGMLPLFGVTLMFLVMMVVVILAMMKGGI